MFNFQTIEKSRFAPSEHRIPDDVVRVSKNYINLASNFKNRFTTYKTPNGNLGCRVKVAYDDRSRALRIQAGDDGDFSARVSETGAVSLNMPTALVRMNILVGDYKLVNGERDIFQLADLA